ncbi:MAG: VOC family protein [Sphingomonadaceae bacterium]|nr:VOC family protein [Sphingomonadaceae bacterium]
MDEPGGPPFAGFYQLAYVTPDIDAAQRLFAETHGIPRFLEMRDARYPTRDGREAHCHLALAYRGAIEIEIIQPIDGDIDFYRAFLPSPPTLVRFHHVCRLFDSRDALEAEVERLTREGRALPINAGSSIARYFYCDRRADLGHFIEGIHFEEEGQRNLLAAIPRF